MRIANRRHDIEVQESESMKIAAGGESNCVLFYFLNKKRELMVVCMIYMYRNSIEVTVNKLKELRLCMLIRGVELCSHFCI